MDFQSSTGDTHPLVRAYQPTFYIYAQVYSSSSNTKPLYCTMCAVYEADPEA